MVGAMAKIDDSVKKKVPELRFKGFTVSATRINKIKNAIGYICSGLGLVGSSNIFEIARTISDYYENFDNLENDWWDVQMAEHAP